jgi:hypothetical protein
MKSSLILLIVIFNISPMFSQVGIGTVAPDASTVLDIQSTNSGVLFPRLTSVQRDAITNPASGLLIYNSNTNSFQYNFGDGSHPNWVSLEANKAQSSTYNVGSTTTGWNYYNVTFTSVFTSIPSINLTYREGVGIDNHISHSVTHFKVANASTTGFTIGVYDEEATGDVFIDWIATPKTQ